VGFGMFLSESRICSLQDKSPYNFFIPNLTIPCGNVS
jgi:hypothetical protein